MRCAKVRGPELSSSLNEASNQGPVELMLLSASSTTTQRAGEADITHRVVAVAGRRKSLGTKKLIDQF